MKKEKELHKLVIDDSYIYLKEKKYKTEYIKKGKITDYLKAKDEIEKILVENNLNKKILKKNDLIIYYNSYIDECDKYVIKSLFTELLINKIEFCPIIKKIFKKYDISKYIIIFYYKDYINIINNNNNYCLEKEFIDSIYNYIVKSKKNVIIYSDKININRFLEKIKKSKKNILYNTNYIMQIFL